MSQHNYSCDDDLYNQIVYDYFIDINSNCGRYLKLKTNKYHGEAYEYEYIMDTDASAMRMFDDKGNRIDIESDPNLIKLRNAINSYIEIANTVITTDAVERIITRVVGNTTNMDKDDRVTTITRDMKYSIGNDIQTIVGHDTNTVVENNTTTHIKNESYTDIDHLFFAKIGIKDIYDATFRITCDHLYPDYPYEIQRIDIWSQFDNKRLLMDFRGELWVGEDLIINVNDHGRPGGQPGARVKVNVSDALSGIQQTIDDAKTEINTQMEQIMSDVTEMINDPAIEVRFTEIEDRITAVEEQLAALVLRVNSLESSVSSLSSDMSTVKNTNMPYIYNTLYTLKDFHNLN